MSVPFACFVFALIVILVIAAIWVTKRFDLKQIIESMTPTKLAKYFLWMTFLVFFLIATVYGRYLTHFNGGLNTDQTVWGTFGDYFGGTLNPILSFLSLIALLMTIVLQSKELDLTREELKRSASAQEDTKKVLDKQSETLARQQFESTFFSLLDQHNKALDSLTTSHGSDTVESIYPIFNDVFLSVGVSHLKTAKIALQKHNITCGHYFRFLYQLLKFIATNCPGNTIGPEFEADKIKNNEVTKDEKMYSNIVRSVIGYSVTQLIAVNCYCQDENDTYWKYKLLIERYSFLEHMPFEAGGSTPNDILLETKDFYEESAFGNSNFVAKLNAGKTG